MDQFVKNFLTRVFLTVIVVICSSIAVVEIMVETHPLVGVPAFFVGFLITLKIWGAP